MGGHVLEILDSILKRPNPVKLVLWDNEGGGEKIIEEIRRRGGVCEMITEASLGAYSAAEPDAAIRREGTTKEETMALIFTSGKLPRVSGIRTIC